LLLWLPFVDARGENLKVIEKIVAGSGLSPQRSGVRWSPLVLAPIWQVRPGTVQEINYPEEPPAGTSNFVRFVHEVREKIASLPFGMAIAEALRTWLDPRNQRRIRVKLGDVEVETNQLSQEEFCKLLTFVIDLKAQDDIRSKVLAAGLEVRVIESGGKAKHDNK
jgi:hypothetical protein